MEAREKVRKLYDFIAENLYLCMPDIEVNGEQFNSTLIFEVLSCLNHGKQMLFGEYGLGKTTSSEQAICLVEAMPKEAVLGAELRGHPEQTEEKMGIARPDLGELNKGLEKVIWGNFVLSNSKIIDEFNRLPPAKQNIILDGIDRGNWKYLSELVQDHEFALFATCNYEDSGNGALIEPVLDRFDIATESKKPSLIQMCMIKDIPNDVKEMLNDAELSDKISEIYASKEMNFAQKKEAVKAVSDEYRERIEAKTGLELLTRQERAEIKDEMAGMVMGTDAELFYTFMLAEMTSCQQYGMKRANDKCPAACHFKDYTCHDIENGLSVRSALAIAKYAKSLAWIAGKEKVTVEEIEKIMPYAIWHKVEFNPQFLGKLKDDQRTEPLRLYAAKKLVEQAKQRFTELAPAMKQYICLMRDGKAEEAAEYIKEMDHPVFKEFQRQTWVS